MSRIGMTLRRAVLAAGALATMVVLLAPTVADTPVIARKQWKAHAAIEQRVPPIKQGKFADRTVVAENRLPARKSAVYLTVHHTGSPARPNVATEQKVLSLQKLVQGGYWIAKKQIFLGDIPYHFYISTQGQVAEGRELKFAAYSNTVYATPIEQHITVVLEGNFEEQMPNAAQLAALTDLLYALARAHHVSLKNIGYHRKVAQTTCPGKHMIAQMPMILEALRKRGLT